jgi:hypothetical protein
MIYQNQQVDSGETPFIEEEKISLLVTNSSISQLKIFPPTSLKPLSSTPVVIPSSTSLNSLSTFYSPNTTSSISLPVTNPNNSFFFYSSKKGSESSSSPSSSSSSSFSSSYIHEGGEKNKKERIWIKVIMTV